MKNEAHLKLKAWIPTPKVAGIACRLVTVKECHIVNVLIGRSTALLESTSLLCLGISKVGDLTNSLRITENLLF